MNFDVMIQRQRSKMGVGYEPAGPARGLKALLEVVEVIRPSANGNTFGLCNQLLTIETACPLVIGGDITLGFVASLTNPTETARGSPMLSSPSGRLLNQLGASTYLASS